MNKEYNPKIPNCQCQCHFPPSFICPMTHCCHCISNENPSNYNPMNFSPYSSTSSFYNSQKPQNMDMMNSYSTNFRSNNDSIGYISSGENIKADYNIRKTRNKQNQDIQQTMQLERNFSDPNFRFNSKPEEQNQQKTYINNNRNNFNYDYNLNNNNSIIMNESKSNLKKMNIDNNTISYKNIINNDNNTKNLTYDYHDNENKKENDEKNIYQIQNPENNQIKNYNNEKIPQNYMYKHSRTYPGQHPQTSNMENIHDMISMLQKENEFLKIQRDDALNKLSSKENITNIDRVQFEELESENNKLRQALSDAMNKNHEKDNIILNLKNNINDLQLAMHDKDNEINDLLVNMKRLEQDANNEIDKLKNKIDDMNREKEALIRNFQKEINDLNNEIRNLNNKLADEERKVKELQNKIKNMKRFDDKKQKLLDNLFNFYNSINKLLNTNTANGKAPPKELLTEIVNLATNEEFKEKLDKIEDKLKQFIDNYKLKFGECFACDIACCTSEVDRLKYFRKYYPGPPKNYGEGRKKCKCP